MSGEQLTAKELNRAANVKSYPQSKTKKVNINDLLYKVRKENDKDKRENYIFLGLVVGEDVVPNRLKEVGLT